jgi:hypothetical protein
VPPSYSSKNKPGVKAGDVCTAPIGVGRKEKKARRPSNGPLLQD